MQTVVMGALDQWGIHAELDESADDYGAVAKAVRSDGEECYIELRIIDASSYGDEDEPGLKGNFMWEILGKDGSILGSFSPDNATELCWAEYNSEQDWHRKRLELELAQPGVTTIVADFLAAAPPTE